MGRSVVQWRPLLLRSLSPEPRVSAWGVPQAIDETPFQTPVVRGRAARWHLLRPCRGHPLLGLRHRGLRAVRQRIPLPALHRQQRHRVPRQPFRRAGGREPGAGLVGHRAGAMGAGRRQRQGMEAQAAVGLRVLAAGQRMDNPRRQAADSAAAVFRQPRRWNDLPVRAAARRNLLRVANLRFLRAGGRQELARQRRRHRARRLRRLDVELAAGLHARFEGLRRARRVARRDERSGARRRPDRARGRQPLSPGHDGLAGEAGFHDLPHHLPLRDGGAGAWLLSGRRQAARPRRGGARTGRLLRDHGRDRARAAGRLQGGQRSQLAERPARQCRCRAAQRRGLRGATAASRGVDALCLWRLAAFVRPRPAPVFRTQCEQPAGRHARRRRAECLADLGHRAW